MSRLPKTPRLIFLARKVGHGQLGRLESSPDSRQDISRVPAVRLSGLPTARFLQRQESRPPLPKAHCLFSASFRIHREAASWNGLISGFPGLCCANPLKVGE